MKNGDRVECVAKYSSFNPVNVGWRGKVVDITKNGNRIHVLWDVDSKVWVMLKDELKLINDNWKPFDIDNPPSVYARIELEYCYNRKNWAVSMFKWPQDAESVRIRVVGGVGYRYQEIEPEPVKRALDDAIGLIYEGRSRDIEGITDKKEIYRLGIEIGFLAGRDPQYDDVEVEL